MSRLKPFAEKKKPNPEVELKLLPRLKVVGCIFFLCGCVSFAYALFPEREISAEELAELDAASAVHDFYAGLGLLTEEVPFELNPKEVLNFYIVGSIFFCIGGALLFVVKKKREQLTQT